MLKISTKGRYGTRVMLDLAQHYEEGYILLKDIAKRQNISEKYSEQIISLLKSANLVNSNRGVHGGYMLAKPPFKITLGEVLKTLEGDLSIVKCVKEPYSCNRVSFCMTRNIWKELRDKIFNTLDSTTLEDVLNGKNKNLKQESGRELTYHI